MTDTWLFLIFCVLVQSQSYDWWISIPMIAIGALLWMAGDE